MGAETDRADFRASTGGSSGARTPNTFLNALIGAAVSVVLGFVPFSPVLGGGVAGYLEGGRSEDGAKVGAISGGVAAIPLAIGLLFVSTVFIFVPRGDALAFSLGFLLVVLFVLIYTVGLSVLGGFLGVYIKREM